MLSHARKSARASGCVMETGRGPSSRVAGRLRRADLADNSANRRDQTPRSRHCLAYCLESGAFSTALQAAGIAESLIPSVSFGGGFGGSGLGWMIESLNQ